MNLARGIAAVVGTAVILTGCSGEPRNDATRYSFEQEAGRLHVLVDGRPFTTLYYGTKWDKPFLYPIRTVSGTEISRGYPLREREGEHTDHPWHRGIWYGHGDVNGEDFWREKGADVTSRLVAVAEPIFSTSEAGAAMNIELSMVNPKGEVLGAVGQRFDLSEAGQNVLIDATIHIAADHGVDLRFGDTEDGGFAFRLMDAFRQDQGARLMNSEGAQGTENIWGKAAKWVDYSADIGGRRIGVAMFDHPSNLRHPSRWHARGYGLNSANPFCLGTFTGNEAADGSYTVSAGESLTLRYRVVVHESDLGAPQLEKLYLEYSGEQPGQ